VCQTRHGKFTTDRRRPLHRHHALLLVRGRARALPDGQRSHYGIAPADWVTRLLGGYVTKEKCWELDTRAAFDALIDVLAGRSARPRRCANNAP
jgi:hypothetical protein